LINRYCLPFSRPFGCTDPAGGADHVIYNCATPIDDACVGTTRKAGLHMPSDKPGLVIRKQLLELLRAHEEEEVHRGSVSPHQPVRIPGMVRPGASAGAC
jgi:hypothetical protein